MSASESGCVIDVSAVCAWCFEDERSPASEALLAMLPTLDLHVPALFLWELGNALVMAERRNRLSQADRQAFLALVQDLGLCIDQAEAAVIWHDGITLAQAHHLTAYDAAYLELAMRRGLPLASRDQALQQAAERCRVPLLPC